MYKKCKLKSGRYKKITSGFLEVAPCPVKYSMGVKALLLFHRVKVRSNIEKKKSLEG